MHLLSIVTLTIAAAAVLATQAAVSRDMSEADAKEAIVLNCHYQMGEFGVEAVQRCIERENAAFAALSRYPERDKSIVSRCAQNAQVDGWETAKSCADRDIEANAALAHYPDADAALIEQCRVERKGRGPAEVRACVDQGIAARAAKER